MLALLACVEPLRVTDHSLTMSEAIPTVGTLTWETNRPARTAVAYEGLETALGPLATTHSATLVGVPPDTAADWTIVDEAGEPLATAAYTTGSLPAELPALTATGAPADRFVLTSVLGDARAAVVLDPDGAIVWAHLTGSEDLETLRVRPAADGTGVLYNVARVSGEREDGAIVRVSWDGATVTETVVPHLAHDFVEHADGTLAVLTARWQDDLRGDAIVEIAPDGTTRDVWTSWDCFDPAEHPGDTPALGWTFANALDHDPATDQYIVGLRNLSTLAWIERATGACARLLGGEVSDYAIDGTAFRHQHQFHAFDDRVLVFDNDGLGTESRAVEYALDGGVARQVWEYRPDPAVYAFVLGDVARLDGGDTLVTWSAAGRIDRVLPDGTPAWTLDTGGVALGFTTLAETLP